MAENFSNDFQTTLSAAIADGVATAISVVSGTGAPAANFRIRVGNEYMLVTSTGAGTNWTVTRGVEGSTAAAHVNGTVVAHVVTTGGFQQYVTEQVAGGSPVTSVAGRTGEVTLGQADIAGLTTADSPAFAGLVFPSIGAASEVLFVQPAEKTLIIQANNTGDAGVLSLRNTATGNAFSALNFLNASGNYRLSLGYGDPGAGAFAGQSFIESTNLVGNNAVAPELVLAQTGTDGSGNYQVSTRVKITYGGALRLYGYLAGGTSASYLEVSAFGGVTMNAQGAAFTFTNNYNGSTNPVVINSHAGASVVAFYRSSNGTHFGDMGTLGTGYTTNGVFVASTSYVYANHNMALVANGGTLKIACGGVSEIARFIANGLLINTITDDGVNKLQVNGGAAISGALKIGNTVNAISPTAPNRTITIDVGGTTFYMHAKTTND